MKKIFSFIFGAVFVFSAFSETGYNGLHWFDSEERCSRIGNLKPYFENDSAENLLLKDILNVSELQTIKKRYTTILGKLNYISYLFEEFKNESCLVGVSYIITNAQFKEIINKFPLVRKYKTSQGMMCTYWFEDETLELLNLSPDLDDLPQVIDDLGMQVDCFIDAISYEVRGEDTFFSTLKLELANEQNENYPGTLYIFDYNKDTRMYVFDNLVKDKAVVVYVPHEQDY